MVYLCSGLSVWLLSLRSWSGSGLMLSGALFVELSLGCEDVLYCAALCCVILYGRDCGRRRGVYIG